MCAILLSLAGLHPCAFAPSRTVMPLRVGPCLHASSLTHTGLYARTITFSRMVSFPLAGLRGLRPLTVLHPLFAS
eukprot:4245792-Pleurochrysis_carterae.AAC.3